MIKLTDIRESEFPEVAKRGICLVLFSAPWCPSENLLEKELDSLANDIQEKVGFYVCDVDRNPALVRQLGVFSIPTLVVFFEGHERERFVGRNFHPMLKACLSQFFPLSQSA